MKENPERARGEEKGMPREGDDQLARVLREASEAEASGQYALASLLALHALQLDPTAAEAKAVFERSQVALGRPKHQVQAPELLPSALPRLPENAPLDRVFREDALRHPIDLDGVPPLTPGSEPRGLGSRLFRAILPFAVFGLLMAGHWLTSSRMGTVQPPAAAPPAVAEPEPAPLAPDPVPDPATGAVAPGTVALDIVPWAKVDAIYSVYDGHEIEPDGLVSPCTVSLPPGRYRFTVSHPDFGSTQLPVIVKSGEVTKLEHSLISNQDLENELAPVLKSAGRPPGATSGSGIQQSAALRR